MKNNKLLILSLLINTVFAFVVIKRMYFKFKYPQSQIKSKPFDIYKAQSEILKVIPDTKDEIILLGDSHTDFFPSEALKNIKVVNMGIAGNTTSDILDRIDDVANRKPSLVILQIGVNDLLKSETAKSTVGRIERIIHEIKNTSPSTRIVLISLFPTSWRNTKDISIHPLILEVNKAMKIIARNRQIKYIDMYHPLILGNSLNPKHNIGDGLHLNSKAYRLWIKVINDSIL